MRMSFENNGYSLTEVLLAVGLLAVGMLFIAGIFPVGIHFTTIATERTIAAVVADEAFAKIRLYGIADFNSPAWPPLPDTTIDSVDFNDVSFMVIDPCEFAYPSTNTNPAEKQYSWSALCRKVHPDPNNRLVQVTVFISRKTNADPNRPMPVKVPVLMGTSNNELNIASNKMLINDGYTIVDDGTGQIYRVLERYADNDTVIRLDRIWDPLSIPPEEVWVVPPPRGGGRYPCIAVYQKVIRF